MALLVLYKLYKNGKRGGCSRTPSQCSWEALRYKAFLLPNTMATKTGTLFCERRQEFLVCPTASFPPKGSHIHTKVRGRKDRRGGRFSSDSRLQNGALRCFHSRAPVWATLCGRQRRPQPQGSRDSPLGLVSSNTQLSEFGREPASQSERHLAFVLHEGFPCTISCSEKCHVLDPKRLWTP